MTTSETPKTRASETPKARVLIRRSNGGLEPDVKPIVLEYKRDKDDDSSDTVREGKARYSKGLEDIQTMEADIVRVSQRAARAVSKGLDAYETERKKSAEEKKDGAIEDFVHNSAKAMSTSLKEASEIPMDIAESINTSSYRKRLRQSLKDTSKIIGFWRI